VSHYSPTAFRDHKLGHFFENAEITVFFGDKHSTLVDVQKAFPDFQFSVLKQTHSDIVIEIPSLVETANVNDDLPVADAQFTREKKIALCIRTADCMPVLIHDPETASIAAIHAGWRGIENEIILRTAAALKNLGSSLEGAQAGIGPHIGTESFEVGLDVAKSLEARFDAVRGFSDEATALVPHENLGKARVKLLTIARAQLKSCGIESERVVELAIDTYISQAYASFRRDRALATRQISFIALK
jgi:polyphenol oxidase